VVDGFGKTLLEYFGLKSAFHDSLCAELKDIIQRVLFISHKTESLKTSNKGRSFKEALGVLGVQGQESSGSLIQK
jgi:hypothetical protein